MCSWHPLGHIDIFSRGSKKSQLAGKLQLANKHRYGDLEVCFAAAVVDVLSLADAERGFIHFA